MRQTEKISNALGKVDDKYVYEACSYTPPKLLGKYYVGERVKRGIAFAASILLLVIGIGAYSSFDSDQVIRVYAYAENELIECKNTHIYSSGSLFERSEDPNGQYIRSLSFHIDGEGIESIRFSSKIGQLYLVNDVEPIKFYDVVKNATITFEDSKGLCNLSLFWQPKLHTTKKTDTIVLEVTQLNGTVKTYAIHINYDGQEQFEAYMDSYKITEEDYFIYRDDDELIEVIVNVEMLDED